MNLFAYVGVNLGVLSLLAITPIQKPTLNDETYKTHLFMLDMGNWEREMKERSWAEAQPCVAYEPPTSEETGRDDSGEPANAPAVLEGSEETPVEEPTTVETAPQPSPLFQVDGQMLDQAIQEYLYTRLCNSGIEWFMPYAICQIYQESRFDIYAVNPQNGLDCGLLQFRSTYWGEGDIFNPYLQIDVYIRLMTNRARNGKTVSEMISCHMMSDYGSYNQEYVDQVTQWLERLVQIR